jgi:septal ring factor EnvC (AmiA/AmiB activator)
VTNSNFREDVRSGGSLNVAYLRLVTHCNLPRTPLHQAMLNDKVEKLQATVAQQQKQIEKQRKQMEIFTAQLKKQAAQIQKVSAQLEMNHRPSQMAVNNH